jgi:hypothetical protein
MELWRMLTNSLLPALVLAGVTKHKTTIATEANVIFLIAPIILT